MEPSARLYYCLACHSQVIICRHCDRGHVYCSSCAKSVRRRCVREAGARYQQTRRGQHCHAQRQQRYRARLRKKVTHHTSLPKSSCDVMFSAPNEQKLAMTAPMLSNIRCHFCHQCCSPYVRRVFLRGAFFENSTGSLRSQGP